MAQITGPFFILSHARSGSTLLRYILDAHPCIACPAELNLGSLCAALYPVLDLTIGRHLGYAKDGVADPRVTTRIEDILRGMIAEHLQATGKRIWCEKSADDVFHLDLLLQVLPEAKFICLYRNSLDVIHSVMEAFRWGFDEKRSQYLLRNIDNPVLATSECWIDVTRTIIDFEHAHPDRCFRLLYEEMVLEHDRVLPPVFEFMGAAWSPELVSRAFTTRHEDGPGDQKLRFATRIYDDLIGKGSGIPLEKIHAQQRAQMDEIHAALGYPALAPGWMDVIRGRFPAAGSASARPAPITMAEIFSNHIPNRIRRAPATMKAVVGLAVRGPDGGGWTIDFERGTAEPRREHHVYDCEIALDRTDLLDIVNERISIAEAYVQGRIRYHGHADKVQDIALFLFGPVHSQAVNVEVEYLLET